MLSTYPPSEIAGTLVSPKASAPPQVGPEREPCRSGPTSGPMRETATGTTTAIEREVSTECVACLCGDTTIACQLVARDEITQSLFTYLRCANCGMDRLCPRPVREEMWRFYPNTYDPYQPP